MRGSFHIPRLCWVCGIRLFQTFGHIKPNIAIVALIKVYLSCRRHFHVTLHTISKSCLGEIVRFATIINHHIFLRNRSVPIGSVLSGCAKCACIGKNITLKEGIQKQRLMCHLIFHQQSIDARRQKLFDAIAPISVSFHRCCFGKMQLHLCERAHQIHLFVTFCKEMLRVTFLSPLTIALFAHHHILVRTRSQKQMFGIAVRSIRKSAYLPILRCIRTTIKHLFRLCTIIHRASSRHSHLQARQIGFHLWPRIFISHKEKVIFSRNNSKSSVPNGIFICCLVRKESLTITIIELIHCQPLRTTIESQHAQLLHGVFCSFHCRHRTSRGIHSHRGSHINRCCPIHYGCCGNFLFSFLIYVVATAEC